jgi:DNA primase
MILIPCVKGAINLSEQYFLEKCIQSAEDVKESYAEMAHMDLDPSTKQMYKDMVTDATRHLHTLEGRLEFLKQQK